MTASAYNIEGLRKRLGELQRQRARCGFANTRKRNWYSNEIVFVRRLIAQAEAQ